MRLLRTCDVKVKSLITLITVQLYYLFILLHSTIWYRDTQVNLKQVRLDTRSGLPVTALSLA